MTDGLNKEGQTKVFFIGASVEVESLKFPFDIKNLPEIVDFYWDRKYSTVRAESTVLFLSFERLSCQFETPYPV